mgnify:FL=1
MRILLDECLDTSLRHVIVGHAVETVEYRGWKGLVNGDLLRAAQVDFNVLLTVDKGIPNQQYLQQFDIALIILRPGKRGRARITELIQENLAEALQRIGEGEARLVVLE